MRALGLLIVLLALAASCGHECNDIGWRNGAHLTLHLPPETSVRGPETVKACRQPTCMMAVVPAALPAGQLASLSFASNEVTGTLELVAGNVRRLVIDWTVDDVRPADPRNEYAIDVTDAGGAVTGQLHQSVTYAQSMPAGQGCGEAWFATASD